MSPVDLPDACATTNRTLDTEPHTEPTPTAMTDARYNARTVETRWQRRWDRECLAAAPPHAASAAPALTLREVRRCVMADTATRFRRACGASLSGAAGAGAHPLLRSLGIAVAWDPASSRDAAAPPAASVRGHDDDPTDLVDAYGADATRWYLVSGTPADAAVAAATDIRGAWRFVHRLWRVVNTAAKIAGPLPAPDRAGAAPGPARDLRGTAHRALARVSTNLDTSRFGLAVAGIHGFARALQTALAASSEPAGRDLKIAAREATEILVQLFHPMMPHLAEECWAALGHHERIAVRGWPAADSELVVAGMVTLPVHVDGRRRAEVTVARDALTGDIAASVFELAAIRQALTGRAPRNVIVVPQRIINVVA
jgi:leucyl-tRNA synthetase